LSRRAALADVLLGLVVLALAGAVAVSLASAMPVPAALPALMVVQGALILAGVRVLAAHRGQSWRHLGLDRPRVSDLGRGLLVLAACIAVNLLFTSSLLLLDPGSVEGHVGRLQGIAGRLTQETPFVWVAAVLCFVGFYEEIFARGLLLGRCRVLTRGGWSAAVVSSLLFGMGHAYQGWVGVVQTSLVGVVLAAFMLRWRRLWPVITAHALLDITSIAALGVAARG